MFNVGDIVDTAAGLITQRQGGKVKYLACVNATQAGGKTCDKKTCPHQPTHCWILWPGSKNTMSYSEVELVAASKPEERVEDKQDAPIAAEEKSVLMDKFADIASKDTHPAQPKSWDAYHGFDKRWASKKDYPDKEPLPESAMDSAFWRRYNYGDHVPIDKRTLR